ncbi:MAG: hypothetical protein ACJAZN_001405 [Planctomycetota bacterium]|jgi:hypothetical protein
MSPKKTSSKKPASSRSAARKESTKAVASGETSLEGASKKVAAKPAPASTKPDQMSTDVLEFIQAIDDYKRLEGRPFPTWSEVLDIVKDLGYERQENQ